MPPENPYAAPQTVDQPADVVGELDAGVSVSRDSIRRGARLTLNAAWLSLLTVAVAVGRYAWPTLRGLVPSLSWILLGAAALCFLLGLVAFWQATTAASIRRLMRIAMIAFGSVLLMNFVDDWWFRYSNQTSQLAWIVMNNLLSAVYTLAFLRGIARLGRVVNDQAVTRSANVASWAWGIFFAWIGGFFLLALVPTAREKLLWIFSAEGNPRLISNVVFLGILMLVGLAGFIRALWRLKRLQTAATE